MARGVFWKTDGFPGAVMALALLLAAAGGLLDGLERQAYDLALRTGHRQPSARIAVIAVDPPGLAEFGPAELPAQLIDRLAAAHPKLIANLLPDAAGGDPARAYLGRVRDIVAQAAADGQPASPALGRIAAVLDEAAGVVDPERRLADSYGRAGNVVLPLAFEPGRAAVSSAPAALANSRLERVGDDAGRVQAAAGLRLPAAPLAERAAAFGHVQAWPDADGVIRRTPLLLRDGEHFYPALSLALAARALDLELADLAVTPGRELRLGKRRIATDRDGAVHPFFYREATDPPAFPVDSFRDLLSGKIPAARYADKIVLLGVLAGEAGPLRATPVSPGMPPLLLLAHETSSLLQGHVVAVPHWGRWAGFGALLLVGLYLAALLPRLSGLVALSGSAALLVLLIAGHLGLLLGAGLWLPLAGAAALLLLGHPVVALSLRAGAAAGGRQEPVAAESNRRLGLAFLGQGQLDLAFDKLRHCPLDAGLMAHLYDLALDFERQRQFAEATEVFRHMATFDPAFRDLPQRLARAARSSEAPGAAAVVAEAGMPPALGRYQLEKELGKGAMGVVYQGRDPQINRVVAIKTMALAQEFEPDELAEVKQRFFREAETAGRLNHPNIVTMYDAGEAGELAYIAMEFLNGYDLVRHARPDGLLPLPVVLSIVARVADALDYAHRHNVVHRDIKPANIMYEPASDQVKVTDFGIARLTDSTRTRTGMVLGTPSFMSPEQLAGKRIDGRSDLFSLGVTLYQLCCGQAPFVGESLAQLMFRIANEPPADIAALRPDLPAALLAVIERALSKHVEQRYQQGAEMAKALRLCLAQLPAAGDMAATGVAP